MYRWSHSCPRVSDQNPDFSGVWGLISTLEWTLLMSSKVKLSGSSQNVDVLKTYSQVCFLPCLYSDRGGTHLAAGAPGVRVPLQCL